MSVKGLINRMSNEIRVGAVRGFMNLDKKIYTKKMSATGTNRINKVKHYFDLLDMIKGYESDSEVRTILVLADQCETGQITENDFINRVEAI